MEDEGRSVLSAKPPPLTSDQLNYLIWRYLQESGYGDAAVKLQRDWNIQAENLPFAKHVKGQALVNLVQKGLRYHHLSLTIDEHGRPSKQLNPAMFFFGPESERQQPEPRELEIRTTSSPRPPSPDSNSIIPRKHQRDTVPNGTVESSSQPAAKKSRKTGLERNGPGSRKTSAQPQSALAVPMDMDMPNGHTSSAQEARSPSAAEGGAEEHEPALNGVRPDERMDVDTDTEQVMESIPEPNPIAIQTDSVGIQVTPAKIANLGPSTTIFDLPQNRQVTELSWRPQDSSILSAHGDEFCGTWRKLDQAFPSTKPQFEELVTEAEPFQVSAVAWEPSGAMLAIATYANQSGKLHLYEGQDLCLLETLPASQRAISCLHWQKSGLRLIGLAPYDDQDSGIDNASSILLWDLSGSHGTAGPLSITVPERLLDLDCASSNSDGIACAAGEKAVYHCRAFSELAVEQKWSSSSEGNDQWAFVRCSWHGSSDAFLVAASIETAQIWLPIKGIIKHNAHEGEITGLQIRPQPTLNAHGLSTSEFATSSTDATIKIWHFDSSTDTLTTLSKVTLGHSLPIMSLSYSPDGFCLAGASYGTIRIWNSEHGHYQMAAWKGSETEWKGNSLADDDQRSTGDSSGVNGDVSRPSTDHSLSWDVDSKRLAFGLSSQIAVINFQR